jgi:hypothetical protein
VTFVKLPTASRGLGNNMIEATVNTPFTTSLPANFSLTVEPGVGLLREANKQGYAGDYQLVFNLNHPVISNTVTAAIELFLDISTDPNTGTRNTMDSSLQWQIGKSLQLDGGAYFGLTKAAVDETSYVGVSYRY